jgi:co-chaperonin GroES (HSP10)
MPVSNTNITGTFTPLHAGVLVKEMKFDEIVTKSGLIIPGDDGDARGIHPRWAEVIAIGSEQEDVSVSQWILVAHGRWSRGFNLNGDTCRTVDPKDILMVSDEKPEDDYFTPSTGHQAND